MALTELQKAQNKAAQLVRNRAHAARLQQYRREMDAVDAEPEVVQARKKFDPDLRSANPVIHGRDSGVNSLSLVLNVLAHDLNRSAAAAHRKVARAPKVPTPQAALYLGELLGPEHAAAHPLEAVD